MQFSATNRVYIHTGNGVVLMLGRNQKKKKEREAVTDETIPKEEMIEGV